MLLRRGLLLGDAVDVAAAQSISRDGTATTLRSGNAACSTASALHREDRSKGPACMEVGTSGSEQPFCSRWPSSLCCASTAAPCVGVDAAECRHHHAPLQT